MIKENLRFGIDLGIGSCGWAVLDEPVGKRTEGRILATGSWMFDVPQTDKEQKPTNQVRRESRLLRRVLRRRRGRMNAVRHLLHDNGLLPSADRDALKCDKGQRAIDPWEVRARALDRPVSPREFGVALGHIAKRRGFQSAAKGAMANKASEDQKMLAAMERTQERITRYRTPGEMLARDPEYSARRRNRDDVYDRTLCRSDIEAEVRTLFSAQRRFGQSFATSELESKFSEIAFFQRKMQDVENLVGRCLFEPEERRAPKSAPSFERFRLLSRLTTLRIDAADGPRKLTPDEIARAAADPGRTAKLSYRHVKKLCGLAEDSRFVGVKKEDEDQDVAVRKGNAMPGTAALRKALGEKAWAEAAKWPAELDEIARVVVFRKSEDSVRKGLNCLEIPVTWRDTILAAWTDGAFSRLTGAGHISAKAARKLLPHLASGTVYSEACQKSGYDHTASGLSARNQVINKVGFNSLVAEMGESIANPVAQKALTEGLKQLWAMRNRFGVPGAICIELARDVGHGVETRRKIESGIERVTRQRERERQEAAEQLNVETESISGDTLLRYRLWKEQRGRCLYTDKAIPPGAIAAHNNSVQVDHILPWSRFGDDSFNNKALCFAGANQQKRNRTPYEWINADRDGEAWDRFARRIETNTEMRGFKKRNFLLRNAHEAERQFRTRNLNDTRYAARLLAEAAKMLYPHGERQEKGGRRRVFTRPGSLTAALRHAWGLESLKKHNGKRVPDDRHHALDALVVAAVDEGQVQRLTRAFQHWEETGQARPLGRVEEPWPGFREMAKDTILGGDRRSGIFVARPERRRARGAGHDATIRQEVKRAGKIIVYERKKVADLKKTDLDRIKDPDRNESIVNTLRAWIEADKPSNALPLSPHGDPIRRVRLRSKSKPAIPVRGGTADRGEMVRVDVFTKPTHRTGREEFYLVPIYRHQVAAKADWPEPPMCYVVSGKDETEWPMLNAEHEFRFSLYQRSFLSLTKGNGERINGYFKGLDRSTGAVNLFAAHDPNTVYRSIGVKRLSELKKHQVDRFGNLSEVRKEARTWHGAVCTFPAPPA